MTRAVRRRLTPQRTGSTLDDNLLRHLLYGEPFIHSIGFQSTSELLDAWKEHKAELLPAFIVDHPLRRPYAWWLARGEERPIVTTVDGLKTSAWHRDGFLHTHITTIDGRPVQQPEADWLANHSRLLTAAEKRLLSERTVGLVAPSSCESVYVFDQDAVDRVCAFAATLQHVKGEYAHRPFRFEKWQIEKKIGPLFGWKQLGNLRKYRTAFWELPRKNGKSSECATLALFSTFCDGEEGAETYSIATDTDQARLVFDPACEMARRSEMLKRVALIRESTKRILDPATTSVYRAVPSDTEGSHGYSASAIYFDEIHAQKRRDLFDVMTTSTASRRQPMTVCITTSGWDRSSICWELHERAREILEGGKRDDTFLPVIYAAGENDRWDDPATWAKANPNLGISVSLEYLKTEAERARTTPSYLNTFLRLHLCRWTAQDARWISLDEWDKCPHTASEADLLGKKCFASVDLGSTRDCNACVLLFPEADGQYAVLSYFWIPREAKSDRAAQDRRQLKNWADLGNIRQTEGDTTDWAYICRDVMELAGKFDIVRLAYDPNAGGRPFAQDLQRAGFPYDKLKEFTQSVGNYAAATNKFEELVQTHKIRHDGNPVLRWMLGNVACSEDRQGNKRPDKQRSSAKIDGAVCCCMSLALAIAEPIEQPHRNWYETHSLEVLSGDPSDYDENGNFIFDRRTPDERRLGFRESSWREI